MPERGEPSEGMQASFSSVRRRRASASAAWALVGGTSARWSTSTFPSSSRVRFRSVSLSAIGEERNALASVHGNSCEPLPDIGPWPTGGWVQVCAISRATASSSSEASTGSISGGRRSAQFSPTSSFTESE